MKKMECPICKKKALFVGVHDDEGNYHGLAGWYYTGIEAPHHGIVTHWMHLPEPPEVSE